MLAFIVRRLLYMIPTLIVISIASFIIIQLPPGDYLTAYIAKLAQTGADLDASAVEALRQRYGLDQPFYIQYLKWVVGMLHGNFGYSFEWNRPVSTLILERLPLTLIVSVTALLFAWAVALPIGIYSAVRQYSIGDYIFTCIGFLGLGIPSFMIALVFLYLSNRYFGLSIGGLFSPDYATADWSPGRVLDLLKHLWIPVVIVGTSGTASLIRITRANVIDELRKPYVETARAKGLPKLRLILKYPVRIALNPFISSMGFVLPGMISGEIIVSIVLNLPTTGPLYISALINKDMYLAITFLMALSILTILGNLMADLLLAWVDPRVRLE